MATMARAWTGVPRDGVRLLHYWWPVVMGWSIAEVAARSTGTELSGAGTAMLLCAVLAAYSLDRLIDPGSRRASRWLRGALLGGLACGVVGGCFVVDALPRAKVGMLCVLAAVALAYPRLKRWPWAKALLVPAVWTWAGLALPTADGGLGVWHAAALPVAAPLFALLASGCLLCDVKDAASDAAAGVRSVPVALGVPATLGFAVALALVGGGLALAEHRLGLLFAAAGLVALAPCRSLLATEALGPLAVDMILTLPGALVAARFI